MLIAPQNHMILVAT